MFGYCKYKGIGIISYAPLSAGHLAKPAGSQSTRKQSTEGTPFEKPLRPSDIEIIKRVGELAEKHGAKMSQVALAWAATKVSSPIVGCNSVRVIFWVQRNGADSTKTGRESKGVCCRGNIIGGRDQVS
jgi:aryl-alcohol dehydrogenase-like predicted oxidoreductase